MISIVNTDDQELYYKEYSEVDFSKEIYRIVRLWLTDKDGNVLLQKRSSEVRFNKNMWALSAGGTVTPFENYKATIIREAKEELGIDIVENGLTLLGKEYIEEVDRKYFCEFYSFSLSESTPSVKFDTTEITETKWANLESLKKESDINSVNFTPDLFIFLERYAKL